MFKWEEKEKFYNIKLMYQITEISVFGFLIPLAGAALGARPLTAAAL